MRTINFNDLPGDIKLKIYNINQEEQRKNQYRIFNHELGKFKMYRRPRNNQKCWSNHYAKVFYYTREWYWINCVGCGKDTSKNHSNYHHACHKCWSKNKYTKTRPLLLDADDCPVIKDNKPVLQPTLEDYCLIDDY
jgi:hypothetical protein